MLEEILKYPQLIVLKSSRSTCTYFTQALGNCMSNLNHVQTFHSASVISAFIAGLGRFFIYVGIYVYVKVGIILVCRENTFLDLHHDWSGFARLCSIPAKE
jgi:hypothetical protein